MTSQYVVVQYGNMITGEYLNIGVYTYDLDKPEVYSKFTINWNRFEVVFGIGKDLIAESITHDWLAKINTKEGLEEVIAGCRSPYSSLQFTDPRASLLDAKALLEDISKDLLSL